MIGRLQVPVVLTLRKVHPLPSALKAGYRAGLGVFEKIIYFVRLGSTPDLPVRDPILCTAYHVPTLVCLKHVTLTFRHRASSILGQAFHCSPENAFYIFNQQIYFII